LSHGADKSTVPQDRQATIWMNEDITETIWTLDGDERSWSSWAETMAQAAATPLMVDIIAAHQSLRQNWSLDIGCGTGRAFLPLVEAGYQVIGIDPNSNSIRLSQQRARQINLPAYPVLASAAQVPVSTASITFVFAIATLFHLSYPELISALQEIQRVLLPGGKAILHFLDVDDWRCSLARRIRPDQAPAPSYLAVVTCFCSQDQIREWTCQAGLKLETLELQVKMTEAGQQRNWLAQCTR
jgi:ubiquinone/menaquinone biosynthesis C-methylase UbiE